MRPTNNIDTQKRLLTNGLIIVWVALVTILVMTVVWPGIQKGVSVLFDNSLLLDFEIVAVGSTKTLETVGDDLSIVSVPVLDLEHNHAANHRLTFTVSPSGIHILGGRNQINIGGVITCMRDTSGWKPLFSVNKKMLASSLLLHLAVGLIILLSAGVWVKYNNLFPWPAFIISASSVITCVFLGGYMTFYPQHLNTTSAAWFYIGSNCLSLLQIPFGFWLIWIVTVCGKHGLKTGMPIELVDGWME